MRFVHISPRQSALGGSVGSAALAAAVIATLIVLPVRYEYPVSFPKLVGFGLCIATAALLAFWQRQPDALTVEGPWKALVSSAVTVFVVAIMVRTIIGGQVPSGLIGLTGRSNGAFSYALLGGLALLVLSMPARLSARTVLAAVCGTGAITTGYSLIQALGFDLIRWTAAGGVSTLGNYDHAASWHAIVCVASIALCCDGTISRTARYATAVVAVGSVFVIGRLWLKSDVIQGVLLCMGGLAMLSWPAGRALLNRAPKLLKPGLVVVSILLAVTLLVGLSGSRGVLHRGYLWAAAGRIALDHPWIGVGADRFGNFYHQYRLNGEVTQFGSANFADDAHSVLAQMGATGGLLVGVPYVVLLLVVGYGVLATFRADDRRLSPAMALSAVTAMAFGQAQFSPETLGIAPWGWLGIAVLACELDADPAQLLRPPLFTRRLSSVVAIARKATCRFRRGAVALAAVLVVIVLARQIRAEWGLYQMSGWLSAPVITRSSAVANAMLFPSMREQAKVILAARSGDGPTASLVFKAFVSRNDHQGALQAAAQLLMVAPRHPAMVIMAADLAKIQLNDKLAHELAVDLTALGPSHPGFWAYRAAAAAQIADLADARRSYRIADSLGKALGDPDSLGYELMKRRAREFLRTVPSP